MKLFLAILIAKITMFFTRTFGKGGNALPGLIALKIDKDILTKLCKNLRIGTIVITGTNGKTTTTKMLSDILKSTGYDVICNNSGSNLSRGLVSKMIERSNITGKTTKGDIGLFEIDEATLPETVPMVNPKIIAVTNLFRDQLDRYGEIDKTASIIGHGLSLAPDATVVLSADDPLVSSLSSFNKKAVYFGLEDSTLNDSSEMDNDNKDCIFCGKQLRYSVRYFSHMGKYECLNCGYKRPSPQTSIIGIELHQEKTIIKLHTASKENIDITLQIPGLYNAYNALTAASVANLLNATSEQIKYSLENTTAAFGRMEKIKINDKYIYLLLVKNPTGFNETLKSIVSESKIHTLFALNDNFADGTDVSWIWDTEIELLRNKTKSVTISGLRAEDMALRMKYAEIDGSQVIIEKNLLKALQLSLDKLLPEETLYVLPTYTAMMDIRNELVKKGITESI